MLKDRNIALFIDVDNCKIEDEHYENVISQLREMGAIASATIYGANEKKHKQIISSAVANGYKVQFPMRNKKRGQRVFDSRIFVDVAEALATSHGIDAVCIVAEPTDFVYLFSTIHRYGAKVIACDNADEESMALVDEIVDLGKVDIIKLPTRKDVETKPQEKPDTQKAQPKVAEVVAPKEQPKQDEQPAKTQEETDLERTAQLLQEIEMLRSGLNAEPKKDESKQPEQKVEEPSIVAETQSLMDRINSYREKPAENTAEPVVEQPKAEEQQPQRAKYEPQDDSDLIRRIEQLRSANADESDSDDLIAQIKKILDEVE